MTTLSDVAKQAHVSKMTVSRVVNHPEKVTEEVRLMVLAIMKELNYTPNYAAKALVTKRTQIIKFLFLEEIDTTEPYYMYLLLGLNQTLAKQRYSLQIVHPDSISVGNCDGFIVTGFREQYLELIQSIKEPLVFFGENQHSFDYVDINNHKGIALTTEQLLQDGYSRILYFGTDIDEPFERSREQGYVDTMSAWHRHSAVYHMPNAFKDSQRFMRHFLTRSLNTLKKERIGIVCATDNIATGVLQAVKQFTDLKIGKDIGITGFDGIYLDRVSHPHITTVRQPILEMGAACGQMILDKITQAPTPTRYLFEPTLSLTPSRQALLENNYLH
ncbi:hypothetical protein BFR42_09785 [Brochothrix thermosphacta]|uniref:LacI family DNA-binding transcriptional regulator n=1 Tax=Brochothrix thermosphacta TaxID=2756 RepID=UPI00083FAE60|nr:LacI family DNA-binding transcriptional regulator [Brochothrix thermosphacta]ODJ61154.1 hypothetical protein BFR42_09785 [Brochothrix thermosphacta]